MLTLIHLTKINAIFSKKCLNMYNLAHASSHGLCACLHPDLAKLVKPMRLRSVMLSSYVIMLKAQG